MITATGLTLVHSLWQCTLIALAIRFLWLWISPRQARLRYGIALAGLLLALAWSVLTFWQYWPAELPVAAVAIDLHPGAGYGMQVLPEKGWMAELMAHPLLLPAMVWMWCGGLLLYSLRLGRSVWQIHRLRGSSRPVQDPAWLQQLQELAGRLGIRRQVTLAESSGVGDPLTIGILRPLILFPVGMINQLAVEEVEMILLHELAHIRRYDYLVNLLQSLVEVIFFYHPAVWWLSAEVQLAREHCCDDLALRHSRRDRMEYARTLTQLTHLSLTRKNQLVMSINGIKGNFAVRIQRLFGPVADQGGRARKALLSALLAGGWLLLFVVLSASSSAEPDYTAELPLLQEETTVVLDSVPRRVVIVDGVEMGPDFDLDQLDENDIAKIEVWKGDMLADRGYPDADALLLITTKEYAAENGTGEDEIVIEKEVIVEGDGIEGDMDDFELHLDDLDIELDDIEGEVRAIDEEVFELEIESDEIETGDTQGERRVIIRRDGDQTRRIRVKKGDGEDGEVHEIRIRRTGEGGETKKVRIRRHQGEGGATILHDMEDAEIYIDGKLSDQEALDRLSADEISTMDVKKMQGAKAQVRVVTRSAAQTGARAKVAVAAPAAEMEGARPEWARDLNIYPNPTSRQSTLAFSLAKESGVKIQLLSAEGRLLEHLFDGRLPAGQHRYNFDLKNTSASVLVKVEVDGEVFVQSVQRQ